MFGPTANKASVVLSTFGGLVSFAPPPSLSEGSSPLCWDVDFLVGSVFTRPGLAPALTVGGGTNNFVWVKTFQRYDGTLYTLALDSAGTLWRESVSSNPGVLSSVENVIAGDLAFGTTAFNREYICFSNHDIPRQYDLTNFDRVSQVGVGGPIGFNAAGVGNPNQVKITAYSIASDVATVTASNSFTPGEIVQIQLAGTPLDGGVFPVQSATGTQFTVNVTAPDVSTTTVSGIATPQTSFAISSITQPASGNIVADDWGAGPGSRNSGTIYTIYYGTTPDSTLVNAFNAGIAVYVYLNFTSGVTFVNGTYQVTGIGINGLHNNYYYFTCNAPFAANKINSTVGLYGTYEMSLATVTLTSPVPNAVAGSQITIQGATPTAWNNTWTILQTPNGGQLTISSTSISAGTASYTFSVTSGNAPVAGDLVTVTNCTGLPDVSNGQSVFNVTNATVATSGGGVFTITGFNPALTGGPNSETGQAVTVGKIFTIDPGPTFVGTANTGTPIFGNDSGTGTIVYINTSLNIAPGTRQAVCMFLTRNGYLTKPSPPVTFTIPQATSNINITAIPLGPPDTIARWIAFTEAGANGVPGAYFYVIPEPVTTIINGQPYTYSPTVINDNVTTSASFSFTDAVLLSSLEIDVPGGNLFNLMELGSSRWNINYANRMFYGLVDNNVQNFLNLTFDGGYVPVTGQGTTVGGPTFDGATGNAVFGVAPLPGPYPLGTLTPSSTSDLGIVVAAAINNANSYVNLTSEGPTGWTNFANPGGSNPYGFFLNNISSTTSANLNLSGSIFDFYGCYILVTSISGATVSNVSTGGTIANGNATVAFGSNVTSGNILMVAIQISSVTSPTVNSVTDSLGNVYSLIEVQTIPGDDFSFTRYIAIYAVVSGFSGANTVTVNTSGFSGGTGAFWAAEISGAVNPGASLPSPNEPLGWTVDPTNGSGGCLITSTTFGDSYYIKNISGTTQTKYGMLSQPAFEDAFNTPIIQPNTTYNVRVAARIPSGNTSGNFVVELLPFNTQTGYGPSVGSFTLPFSSLTTITSIQTGTLLTTLLNPVPSTLVLRIYASNIAAGADIEVDRIEIFPTNTPLVSGGSGLVVSYVNNPESFDQVTGILNVSGTNTQPVNGAFVMYDQLYLLKSGSMFSTQDSPGAEPSGWTVHEVSNEIGTVGPNAYDVGEEWMVTASRKGLYVFYGKQPFKLSQEIFQVWETINWSAASTIWVRNDIVNRRILVGVPMATPNAYLPNAPVNANPTTPNVILMLNYLGLGDVTSLGSGEQMHTTMFGTLMSVDMRRKWTIWQIPSPYADFITRADGFTAPLFIGNGIGSSKIYQLSQSQLSDDGAAINSLYTTYGWVDLNKQQQSPLLNFHRKIWTYLQMLLSGSGNLTLKMLPNNLVPSSPFQAITLPPIALLSNPGDDYERSINVAGNRVYLQFSTNAVGAAFALERVIMVGGVAPLMIRGSSSQ